MPRSTLLVAAALVCLLFSALTWLSRGQDRRPKTAPVDTGAAGLVGDGKTDITQALQQAIDGGMGNLSLPRGVYRITRPIVIDLDKVGPVSIHGHGTATIVMDGPGPAFKFVGTHDGTANPRTVKPNVWKRQRTPLVDGVEIVGSHPEAVGLEATGTMQLTVTRLVVRKALHGIHLTGRNRNVIVSECHLYENAGVGLYLDKLNLHQINVTNCHISYNAGGGIVVRESEIRNLHIGTCDIEGNMTADAPPTANILLDTRKGSIREGAIVGCTIQHTHNGPDAANIRFLGRSAEDASKVGHFAIADNAMSDVAVNVHLQHARGVTLTGNTCWKAFEHNLLVENSSQIVLGPNLFDRNPDYRPHNTPNDLLFVDCRECTLSGVHINHTLDAPAGLTLKNCRRMNVTGCTILNCDHAGLLLENTSRSRVSDCYIEDTREDGAQTFALRVTGGRQNQIVDNYLVGKVEIPDGSGQVKDNLIPQP